MVRNVGYALRTFYSNIKAPNAYPTIALLLLYLSPYPAVADVSVNGLNNENQKNVQLTLSLSKQDCKAPEWKIRGLFDKSDREAVQALQALGYYHPDIKKSLSFNANCWHADYMIDAGPRTTVADIVIDVKGDARGDPKFEKLRSQLLAEAGKPLRHDNYEKMKDRIESLALERGYLKSGFSENKLLIDTAHNLAHIKLTFDSGKRMVVGNIEIEQDFLNPEFVRKFLSIKSGDFYSADKLAKTHSALSKSGYFERVDISPDIEHAEQGLVPIDIVLTPAKKHHYSFGLGYDTDFGPLGSAAYNNRRINRQGHYINASLDIAPVLSTADAEYAIPLDDPVNESLSFGAGFKHEDTITYRSKAAKLSTRWKHAFDNGWKQTLYIDPIYEDFSIGNTSDQVFLVVPGGSWLRSVADSTTRPTRGYRLELNLAGSTKPISEVSFAQAQLSAVWTHPLPWRARFLTRAVQGATLVDNFDKLPPTYRFFAGGMNSVRGYAYRRMGPKDIQDNIIGGKFLSVVSAEYEHYLFDDWGLAAFVDGGNAYNIDKIRIKLGAGLGLRWYSPIGPIRIDFAMPVNDSESGFQIHFAAGTRL